MFDYVDHQEQKDEPLRENDPEIECPLLYVCSDYGHRHENERDEHDLDLVAYQDPLVSSFVYVRDTGNSREQSHDQNQPQLAKSGESDSGLKIDTRQIHNHENERYRASSGLPAETPQAHATHTPVYVDEVEKRWLMGLAGMLLFG